MFSIHCLPIMEILIGLLIIAAGAFCQSSCYVPINKVREWSWESYRLIQGVFAWLLLPLLGAELAVPSGYGLIELLAGANRFHVAMTVFFGVLWGVGGLTFGLSMRYLGVALGQSIALGTCAGQGTIMGPVLINAFFPEEHALSQLTASVLIGVAVTLLGIAIIGWVGKRKFGELTPAMYSTLPATQLVTLGDFVTNAVYCLWQNQHNHTWGDYGKGKVWGNNLFFCFLAGARWYSQFFGLSLDKGFLTSSPVLTTLSFCILMALNVVFSNVWGIILKEWKGCDRTTIVILVTGIVVLLISCFLPQII